MSVKQAIHFLRQKMDEDEQPMDFSKEFMYRPWDGAAATMTAIKRAFGAMGQKGVPGFFGETPPRLITINISATETMQVPWGGIVVPHLPGMTFYTSGKHHEEYGSIFVLTASGPRKYRFHVEGLFRLVEEELRNNSIYRGKAFDGQEMPSFLDLNGVDPAKVIYSEETTVQLEANVWSLLKYSDKMEALGVPLKRAVLLEGPYGTGKTLAAYLTARVADANGWTFLLCRPGRDDFFKVMGTARLYQPAVVFFEDVDALADSSQDHVRELLDIFDGIQAKGTKIICVLTTNHVDKIHKGMVRPGRLDAVIHVGALDASGIRRLIEATVDPSILAIDGDGWWDQIAESMEGFMPAFVREAIDRAVRYNVARNDGEVTKLEGYDFIAAAHGLRPQLELMEGAKEGPEKDPLSQAMGRVIRGTVNAAIEGAGIVDSDGDEMYTVALRNGAK
jgi:transitional endoplasmic reticulum ATPase